MAEPSSRSGDAVVVELELVVMSARCRDGAVKKATIDCGA
jgi:hypothetical protein